MVAWPSGLPFHALQDGFVERPGDVSIRTPTETGPAKRRRRYTAEVRQYDVRMLMTNAQINILDDFYFSTLQGGVLTFTWQDPRNQVEANFAFVGPPAWVPASGADYYAQFVLERRP